MTEPEIEAKKDDKMSCVWSLCLVCGIIKPHVELDKCPECGSLEIEIERDTMP